MYISRKSENSCLNHCTYLTVVPKVGITIPFLGTVERSGWVGGGSDGKGGSRGHQIPLRGKCFWGARDVTATLKSLGTIVKANKKHLFSKMTLSRFSASMSRMTGLE